MGMQLVQILSITVSLMIMISVIEFIRRGAFKERYAILWLFASVILLILSIWRNLLHYLAQLFGFYYPPSFLFLVGFGFLMLITLHFSMVISSLSEKNKKLAQEIGLMKDELEALKKERNAPTRPDHSQGL
jgi:hypothetical protein